MEHYIDFESGLVKEGLKEAIKVYNVTDHLDKVLRPIKPDEILPFAAKVVMHGSTETVSILSVDGEEAALEAILKHELDNGGPIYHFVAGYLASKGQLKPMQNRTLQSVKGVE